MTNLFGHRLVLKRAQSGDSPNSRVTRVILVTTHLDRVGVRIVQQFNMGS
jgi:hypothetical protein